MREVTVLALYVVTGSPGCGKSTWVRNTAKPGDIRFGGDEITNTITGKTETKHHHDNTTSKISRAMREAGIREAIKHQREIDIYVLVSNLSKQDERKWRARGARFIIIDPGYDVALQRCRDNLPGYKHRMVGLWYDRKAEWPADAQIIRDFTIPEETPAEEPAQIGQATATTVQPNITDLGLGWKHQRQRKRLLARLKDGEPCWWCGKPMYRDAKNNFDAAPLEADHSQARRDHGTKHLADRLLHRRCNRQRGAGDRDHERPAIATQRSADRAPVGTDEPFVW